MSDFFSLQIPSRSPNESESYAILLYVDLITNDSLSSLDNILKIKMQANLLVSFKLKDSPASPAQAK